MPQQLGRGVADPGDVRGAVHRPLDRRHVDQLDPAAQRLEAQGQSGRGHVGAADDEPFGCQLLAPRTARPARSRPGRSRPHRGPGSRGPSARPRTACGRLRAASSALASSSGCSSSMRVDVHDLGRRRPSACRAGSCPAAPGPSRRASGPARCRGRACGRRRSSAGTSSTGCRRRRPAVSQPWRSISANTNSSCRVLLPPKQRPVMSSRLIQISGPPSACDRRGAALQRRRQVRRAHARQRCRVLACELGSAAHVMRPSAWWCG